VAYFLAAGAFLFMIAAMFYSILSTTVHEWFHDKASRLGAALAFYAVLSIGPLLLVAISLAGIAFGKEAASGQIFSQIRGLVGEDSAAAIQTILANSSNMSDNIWATMVGFVILLATAAGFFAQLQDALNIIWKTKAPPVRNIWRSVRRRFVPFVMLLAIGFLLFMSVMITAILTIFEAYFPGSSLVWLNHGISLLFTVFLFASIFKILPDAQILWREVWVGALATALLFSAGKYFIGLYLQYKALDSTYGAAGSLIVVLVWIYYSAQIFLLGAEFTQVYAKRNDPK